MKAKFSKIAGIPMALALAGGISSAANAAYCPEGSTDTRIRTAIITDLKTGAVLGGSNGELNADEKFYPASITKLMTLYIALQELKSGRADKNEMINIPDMLFKSGTGDVTGKDAIPNASRYNNHTVKIAKLSLWNSMLATNLASSNLGPYAIAKRFGGVTPFVQRMNDTAAQLGMANTHFENPAGFPFKGVEHKNLTTARDLSKLVSAMFRQFPEEMAALNITVARMKGIDSKGKEASFTVTSHSAPMLEKIKGKENPNYSEYATSAKTGYACSSGWNIAVIANYNGRDVFYVTAGHETALERDEKVAARLAGLPQLLAPPVVGQASGNTAVAEQKIEAADADQPMNKWEKAFLNMMLTLGGLGAYSTYIYLRDRKKAAAPENKANYPQIQPRI